jgi:hypothetical protein
MIAVSFLVFVVAMVAAEERALVLLDNPSTENTHSAFFTYLQDGELSTSIT